MNYEVEMKDNKYKMVEKFSIYGRGNNEDYSNTVK